ncbi:glycosyltransferase, partial [Enterobacter roggenkampii]|uniref:glycosyltransferase n=1 Tax=Enterobacter roggenkampii TaxID=1812935 RepID=UPI003BEF39E7
VGRLREAATGYDVVHCHHVYSGIIAGLARVSTPVVVSFQNDWLHEVEIPLKPVQIALCNLGVRIADRVIFKSPIPPQFRGKQKFV